MKKWGFYRKIRIFINTSPDSKLCASTGNCVDFRAASYRTRPVNSYSRSDGYSKGMLQRIGLAQALIQDPRLLVLDEPTAGVDPRGSAEIRDLIVGCKQRGITVLLCSHLLGQVQEICDRIGILDRGILVREGRLEELISIEDQTEVVFRNAPPDLLADIRKLVGDSHPQATLLDIRKPQTTLERYFLDVTSDTAAKKD